MAGNALQALINTVAPMVQDHSTNELVLIFYPTDRPSDEDLGGAELYRRHALDPENAHVKIEATRNNAGTYIARAATHADGRSASAALLNAITASVPMLVVQPIEVEGAFGLATAGLMRNAALRAEVFDQ